MGHHWEHHCRQTWSVSLFCSLYCVLILLHSSQVLLQYDTTIAIRLSSRLVCIIRSCITAVMFIPLPMFMCAYITIWLSECDKPHTHPFNGPLSGTTWVSLYRRGKTNLDFTGARDSEWYWHQLGRMQVCTSLQTDNHASTPPLSFFTGRMPFPPPNQQRQSTEGTSVISHVVELLLLFLYKSYACLLDYHTCFFSYLFTSLLTYFFENSPILCPGQMS